MVKTPGAKAGPGALRPLNTPRPLNIRTDAQGQPTAVRLGEQWLPVTSIQGHWRIEDEWWRERPISRAYFRVLLADGRRMTLYRNLKTERWYSQRYD